MASAAIKAAVVVATGRQLVHDDSITSVYRL